MHQLYKDTNWTIILYTFMEMIHTHTFFSFKRIKMCCRSEKKKYSRKQTFMLLSLMCTQAKCTFENNRQCEKWIVSHRCHGWNIQIDEYIANTQKGMPRTYIHTIKLRWHSLADWRTAQILPESILFFYFFALCVQHYLWYCSCSLFLIYGDCVQVPRIVSSA